MCGVAFSVLSAAFVLPVPNVPSLSSCTTSHSHQISTNFPAAPRSKVICDETKGAIGGAVLGGLIAGPFGALWGAQIGGTVGANKRAKLEAQQRLDNMGLSKEVIDGARAVAQEIEEAEQNLMIVQSAEASQQSLLQTLEDSAADAYYAASEALRGGDEAAARTHLEKRQGLLAKINYAKAELAEASDRVAIMQTNMASLKQKATEIEALVARSVATAADMRLQGSSEAELEDPLLRKFRELGED